jgi:hypothetical protein
MRNLPSASRLILVAVALSLLLPCSCAHSKKEREKRAEEKRRQEAREQLKDDLKQMVEESLESQRQGPSRPLGDPQSLADLKQQGRGLLKQIRERLQAELTTVVAREFGPMKAAQVESIMVAALDKKGRVVEIPMSVETRQLRMLSDPVNASKTRSILTTEELALPLYDDLPSAIAPTETKECRRSYLGDAASAIAMEAKLVVTLKGGEWVEPQGNERVANAIAIRGLDLDRGLLPNSNKTYDDTMYIILEKAEEDPEVYEYRMTTESSSEKQGVGRLKSKQVKYYRGLHRGKDPAYRLKGNVAEGTRQGLKGTHKIVGANIHSAYSRRTITSETPLSPKVSLGCQAIAASKSAFEQSLVFFLDKKGVKEFPYTIVDGDELALLDRTLQEKQRPSVLVRRVLRPEAPKWALKSAE